MKTLILNLAAIAAMTATSATLAADAVTDAMQAAYAPYRAALFRTNGKSVPEAQQAMSQAKSAWQAIAERYAAKPPAPYDRDVEFGATLTKVSRVFDQAATQINDNKLSDAHATLEAARDLMADLRHRNQVVTYSDHMNAYHAQMEHLLDDGTKWLADPQGGLRLLAQTGVLEFLARRLRSEAPASLRADADFNTSLQAVEASVASLKAAAMAQDLAALREAMPKLKSPYSRLFLRFG